MRNPVASAAVPAAVPAEENAEKAAPAAPAAEKRTVEEWRAAKASIDWQFAAARAGNRWPLGLLLTEAQFDDALERAAHVTAG